MGEEEGQAPGSGGHSIVEVKYARTGPGRNRKIHNNEILVVLWDVCGTSLAGPLGRIQGLVWADKMEWNAIREDMAFGSMWERWTCTSRHLTADGKAGGGLREVSIACRGSVICDSDGRCSST